MTRGSFFKSIAALFTGAAYEAQARVKHVDEPIQPMLGTKPIKVACSGSFSGTTVEIDGSPIQNVRTISFTHVAGDLPKLTLEIIAKDGVEIDGWSNLNNLVICPMCSDTVEQSRAKQADRVASAKAIADLQKSLG